MSGWWIAALVALVFVGLAAGDGDGGDSGHPSW
jgi:hypothetical protein